MARSPMIAQRKQLGKILEEMKLVTPVQLQAALQKQMADSGQKLGEILIEMKVATPRQVAMALARQYNLRFVELDKTKISPDLISAIPRSVAEEHKIMPVQKNGKTLTVAMSDPLDVFTMDNLKFMLNMEIEIVLATRDDVQTAIEKYYSTKERKNLMDAVEEATSTGTDIQVRGLDLDSPTEVQEDSAPVIKFVNMMISEAVKARASDIHVEPMENRVRIRTRVDGVCIEVKAAPKRLQAAILSRIKIMGGMDIAEKRKPQDGRIKILVGTKELDIRVSALPATHGESIVMRLLDKESGLVGLEELGFHPSDHKRFKSIIKRPNGIFLVTGPTGSGKTTTLYAALKELNRPDVKIITAENPVEYNLAGINQSQVRAQIGLTFPRILRAMLRQAPNIILVGEIRDEETAEIAIQASLTGHLVFSTLHTNDAPSALTRLLDMGIKPFLVASSIQAIMAQRLVRILCPACKEPEKPEASRLAALGLKPSDVESKTIYKPVGCSKCNLTGYRGRKGIFELLELNSTIRELVFRKDSVNSIKEQARLSGMTTLLEDGIRKILDGMTAIEEVVAITHREDLAY